MIHEGEQSLQKRTDLIPTHILKGGLIEAVVGEPERRMDGIVKRHLDRVALLQARGDTSPERPVYIFNPDSRLLINYSLRRDENPDCSGLFAEIVELDEEGKPRHGVGMVNPFRTEGGFLQVDVGDNLYGFTPSSIDMKLDSENPLDAVPPNISTADLMSMLSAEPVAEDEKLDGFLARTRTERDKIRGKVELWQRIHYAGTNQRLSKATNHSLHLILSDRDTRPLADASRELGLFPIQITITELIEKYRALHSYFKEETPRGESLFSFRFRNWLTEDEKLPMGADYTPAFVTFDYFEPGEREKVISVLNNIIVERVPVAFGLFDNLIENNPVFAYLSNENFQPEYDAPVKRLKHGFYIASIDPADAQKMKEYKDWLRKVKLDMALTLYLRGLSQL